MHDPHDVPAEPAAPRRRRWGAVVGCLLLVAGLLVGGWFYLSARGEMALRAAIKQTDDEDPEWRLWQLEEKRVCPPDKDNAALRVQAVKRLLPRSSSNTLEYAELFEDLVPEAQLNAPQIRALKMQLQNAVKARDAARELADMPNGYFVINWAPDFISTLLPGIQEAREVVSLLADDAMLRAQEKDADGAVRSLQAALNAGRSTGDVPGAIAQLVRIAGVSVTAVKLERILAQGEPAPAVLAELQHLLEDEDHHPYLLVMARGERAGSDQLMTWLESGKASPSHMAAMFGDPHDRSSVLLLYLPGEVKKEHAELLRYLNQFVEGTQLPEAQRKERFDELEAVIRHQGSPLVRLLAPALIKVAEADQRGHAQLRCAIVLLAAERYRREHNRWPATLPDLVAGGYLKEVPSDPYDGAPLRLKRVEDGLVIYSVGADCADNGGKIDRKTPLAPGTDLGLRLWDVGRRRQPPLPPRVKPKPGTVPPGGGPPDQGPAAPPPAEGS
jgi:hypothetical protein